MDDEIQMEENINEDGFGESNQKFNDGDDQPYKQDEEGDVETAAVGLQIFYYLLQILIVTLYAVNHFAAIVHSFLGLLVDHFKAIVHIFHLFPQNFYSSNDPINHIIKLLVLLIPDSDLLFIFFQIFGKSTIGIPVFIDGFIVLFYFAEYLMNNGVRLVFIYVRVTIFFMF